MFRRLFGSLSQQGTSNRNYSQYLTNNYNNKVDVLKGKLTRLDVLDKGFIELKDVMPRLVPSNKPYVDYAITEAARVSYGAGTKSISEDRPLLRHLVRNYHTSPLEMVELKFIVRLPIFIERQWVRHRTANINEESGRYSVMIDDFYRPDTVLSQSTLNKQGSDLNKPLDEETTTRFYEYLDKSEALYEDYKDVLDKGVSREIARIALPLSTYTTKYWKCDLHNILKFLQLRMDKTAQKEIRDYANAMFIILKQIAPDTCEAFENYWYENIRLSKQEIQAIRTRDSTLITNKTERREFNEKLNKLNLLESGAESGAGTPLK
jgi:thymidylate synthase (FAD)